MVTTAEEVADVTAEIADYDVRIVEAKSSLECMHQQVLLMETLRQKAVWKLATMQATMQASSSSQIVASSADPQAMALTQRRQTDVIQFIGHVNGPADTFIHADPRLLASQHTSKLRCIEFFPNNPDRFVTSAVDGIIKVWEFKHATNVPAHVLDVNGMYITSWPEDISLNPHTQIDNPHRQSLIAVYTQREKLAHVRLSNVDERRRVFHSKGKPHVGGIKRVKFMISRRDELPVFVTAGKAGEKKYNIALWRSVEKKWVFSAGHASHTNQIMGLCGLYHKKEVISIGEDRKVLGYDYEAMRMGTAFKQLHAKGIGIAANPVDENLICLLTKATDSQIRLVDVRDRNNEAAQIGWTEDRSSSSLIGVSWSPNGMLISSGSSGSSIHVFDIRYNKFNNPTDSYPFHHKTVYKAIWHPTRPLLLSISSDKNVGIHTMSGSRYE